MVKLSFKSHQLTKVVSDVDELQIRQLERLSDTWTTAYDNCSFASESWLAHARLLKVQANKLKSRNGD